MEWFGSTHSSYQILFSILFSTADSTPSLVGGIRHSDTTWNCHEIIFNVMQTQEQWSILKVCLVVTARSQCSKIKDCWKKNRRVWEILRQSAYEEMTLVVACCTSDDHLWPISGPISWACLECWLRWGADGKPKKSELSLAVPHSGNTTYVLPMRGPSSQADKSGGVLWQPSPIRHWAVVFPLCPYSVDKRPDSGVCHPLCLLSRHGAFLLQYNANVLFRTPPPIHFHCTVYFACQCLTHCTTKNTFSHFLTFSSYWQLKQHNLYNTGIIFTCTIILRTYNCNKITFNSVLRCQCKNKFAFKYSVKTKQKWYLSFSVSEILILYEI